MKTYKLFGLITILALLIAAMPMQNADGSDVFVYKLYPSWTEPCGGGVFSAYVGPPDYGYVSPGATALYLGREAGIIKAGLALDPDGHYWDEGLFAFKPNVTIDVLAAGTLTYDVMNQYGENPVWITIEIDTGEVDDRGDNTTYQFVPTTNPADWHTVDAAAGLWQKWNNNMGDTTGNPSIPLSDVVTAHAGLNVVRAYLRLGMGDSYHGTAGLGTVAWVDKATIGGVMYDFVLPAKYFDGFFQPIDNDTVNIAKAGQAIPVKWRLVDFCVPVSDPTSFEGLHSYNVSCDSVTEIPTDVIEEYAGNSGLQYQGDGNWQFNWKTSKTYANTCRAMYVEFSNGTFSPVVIFQFKK
jgi:hypothetical protein